MSTDNENSELIQISSPKESPATIGKEMLLKLLKILRNFLLCMGIAISLFLASSLLSIAKEENEYHLFHWLLDASLASGPILSCIVMIRTLIGKKSKKLLTAAIVSSLPFIVLLILLLFELLISSF